MSLKTSFSSHKPCPCCSRHCAPIRAPCTSPTHSSHPCAPRQVRGIGPVADTHAPTDYEPNRSTEKSIIVVVNLFFLCRPYVTRIQQKLDKKPQNCNDSFSCGSILTTSQHDGDNKDSLNELPFSSQRTFMKSHSVHWLVGFERKQS